MMHPSRSIHGELDQWWVMQIMRYEQQWKTPFNSKIAGKAAGMSPQPHELRQTMTRDYRYKIGNGLSKKALVPTTHNHTRRFLRSLIAYADMIRIRIRIRRFSRQTSNWMPVYTHSPTHTHINNHYHHHTRHTTYMTQMRTLARMYDDMTMRRHWQW
jgi:hypothetical protein